MLPSLAAVIHAVATTDTPTELAALVAQLRRDHPGDPEATLLARVAELKRRRLVQEN